jgi:hypothetical protein
MSSQRDCLIGFLYIGYPTGELQLPVRPFFEDRTMWME